MGISSRCPTNPHGGACGTELCWVRGWRGEPGKPRPDHKERTKQASEQFIATADKCYSRRHTGAQLTKAVGWREEIPDNSGGKQHVTDTQRLALLMASCVTLGRSLSLSEPQLSHPSGRQPRYLQSLKNGKRRDLHPAHRAIMGLLPSRWVRGLCRRDRPEEHRHARPAPDYCPSLPSWTVSSRAGARGRL